MGPVFQLAGGKKADRIDGIYGIKNEQSPVDKKAWNERIKNPVNPVNPV